MYFLGSHFGHHLAEVLGIDTTEQYRKSFLQLVEDVHKLGIAWREGYRYVDVEKTDFSRGPGVWVYK